MRILDLVEDTDIEEARRNNYGREVSNAQGQALGKQLGAGNPNAQQGLAQAKAAQANNQTDAGGDALGQTTPQQRLAAKKANSAPVNLPGIGRAQNSNNAANTNVPAPETPTKASAPVNSNPQANSNPPAQQQPNAPQGQDKGPGIMSTLGKGAKALGGVLSKAADAAPGVINKVGNIGSAATDAAGRTLGGFGAGYNYARHGQGQVHQPGQRTDAPHMQQQAPAQQGQQAPAQQGGGIGGAIAGAARNFAQNATGGGGADFNTVMKAIPKLTPKQKAAVAKAVGAPAAKPAGAPPAPKVVQGGKPPAPQQAVAEGFHSKFLGMII